MPDLAALSATCTRCGDRLWKQRRGDWTLAQRILKVVGGGIVAICPECGSDVPVPWLRVAGDAAPVGVPASNRARRYVVRVDGTSEP